MPMLLYSPKKIVTLRKAAGMNASELAKRAGISGASLWYIEKGITVDPKFATIDSLAKALGVPVPMIMADKVDPDIDAQIAAAVGTLSPKHKATLLNLARSLGTPDKPD